MVFSFFVWNTFVVLYISPTLWSYFYCIAEHIIFIVFVMYIIRLPTCKGYLIWDPINSKHSISPLITGLNEEFLRGRVPGTMTSQITTSKCLIVFTTYPRSKAQFICSGSNKSILHKLQLYCPVIKKNHNHLCKFFNFTL